MNEEQIEIESDLPETLQEEKISFKEKAKKFFSVENVVRNIPFILFLSVLAVLYIANSGRALSLLNQIDRKNAELKELKWEYLDVQSRLINATSEAQLAQKTTGLGLKVLEKPAFEIRDTIKIRKEIEK